MQYNFPLLPSAVRRARKREAKFKAFSFKAKKGIKTSINQKTSHNHEMEKFLCSSCLQPSDWKKGQQQKSGLCLPFGFPLVIFAKENINISFRKFFTKSQPICCVMYFLCLHKRKLFLIINFTCFSPCSICSNFEFSFCVFLRYLLT
jgi:hypothetical protein